MPKLLPDTALRLPQGHLSIGGCDVVELADRYGTPLYIYDQETLHHAASGYVDALRAHYPAAGSVVYASKAYMCTAIARLWAAEGLGMDVIGPGELAAAQRAGFPPEHIHLQGNNKPPDMIAQAIAAGVGRIVLDGWQDFEAIERLSPAALSLPPVSVWLRVAPGIDAHTHDYRKTGMVDSKFGFPIATGDAMLAIERALHSPVLRLCGLHAHIGSQIFEVEPFVACAERLLDLAAEARDRWGWVSQELDPGGGWGVPYTADQPDLPPDVLVKPLCRAVVDRCRAHGLPLPHLFIEPGRSLVARAGVAVYTVGGRKVIPNVRTYVALDGGLPDNPRPALYGAQYAPVCANRVEGEPETVTLCGPCCESGDVLARDVSLPAVQPGDLIAVPVSGAYQLAMSSNYNGLLRPAVLLVADGWAQLIQRRETVQDLLQRDVIENIF